MALARPATKGVKAEYVPEIAKPDNWDPVMQNGIMCATFSSGNPAIFGPLDFWAVQDEVMVISPGHYKLATRGAAGEGVLVSHACCSHGRC